MSNLRIAQRAYDDMNEPEYHDFDSDPMFAEFVEYVTLELLAGNDCQGIDAQIFMIDLELATGDYQIALEWVYERLTEKQYLEYLEVQNGFL